MSTAEKMDMPEPTIGSEEWGGQLRQRAKDLAVELESGYMRLGEILYRVWATPIDGDQANPPIYTAWGFDKFTEWAEHELDIPARKANYLRQIYETLYIKLEALPQAIRDRVIAVGYSKARILVGVLTLNNAEVWVERAERCSFAELQALQAQYRKQLKEEKEAAKRDGKEEPEEPSTGVPDTPHEATPDSFMLFPEQREIVNEALMAAEAVSNSSKRGHNLTLICMDYLATNGAAPPGEQAFREYLANLERMFQVRFVAIDPKTQPHELLYGMASLEDLFRSRGIGLDGDKD